MGNTKKTYNWNEVIAELDKKIIGEKLAKNVLLASFIGRLVENANNFSYHTLPKGASSTGKDKIVNSILSIFPKKYILHRRRISRHEIDYMDSKEELGLDDWNGVIIYLEDISQEILNSESLKTRMSGDGAISVVDNRKSKTIQSKGKPVFVITTAESIPNTEMINRLAYIQLDETQEQTKNVVNAIFQEAEEGKKIEYDENIKKFIENLKSYNVKIPFATKIAPYFPTNEVKQRRNAWRFIDYIKAIAVFNQNIRKCDEKGYLLAEIEDYDLAREIFEKLPQNIAEIPLGKRQEDIVKALKISPSPLMATEINTLIETPITLQCMQPHLNSLVGLGIVEKLIGSDKYNRAVDKYILKSEYKEPVKMKLPTGQEINDIIRVDNENYQNIQKEVVHVK